MNVVHRRSRLAWPTPTVDQAPVPVGQHDFKHWNAVAELNLHFLAGLDSYLFDILNVRMPGKCTRKAGGQIGIQKLQALRQTAP